MLITTNTFRTEAAGRSTNEDNGCILNLKENGLLMCVCDGMGGTAAGEIASSIAVNAVKERFSQMPQNALQEPTKYLEQSVVCADYAIKLYSEKHLETMGMGSTIVLAWILNGEVFLAWCGDSRAYRYNSSLGLERLTHDHSLVQTWVDNGTITEKEAFNHPQSNIITRSLGNPESEAQPENAIFSLYNGDVIMLCSDGLWGTLRDDEIEQLLEKSDGEIGQIEETLWQNSKNVGWHDNVTTAITKIIRGGVDCIQVVEVHKKPYRKYWPYLAIAISAAVLLLLSFSIVSHKGKKAEKVEQCVDKCKNIDQVTDSIEKDTIK
jgi:serine/threonine protein phosphatase PrpC